MILNKLIILQKNGDWAKSTIPNPQSPFPINFLYLNINNFLYYFNFLINNK